MIVYNKSLNLPKILLINLENAKTGQLEIDEQIDLEEYVTTNIGPKIFNLFEVINKKINNSNEFYVAYIKKENSWISFNGEEIINCTYEDIYSGETIYYYK